MMTFVIFLLIPAGYFANGYLLLHSGPRSACFLSFGCGLVILGYGIYLLIKQDRYEFHNRSASGGVQYKSYWASQVASLIPIIRGFYMLVGMAVICIGGWESIASTKPTVDSNTQTIYGILYSWDKANVVQTGMPEKKHPHKTKKLFPDNP